MTIKMLQLLFWVVMVSPPTAWTAAGDAPNVSDTASNPQLSQTAARKYHIVTMQGSGLYQHWQMRIHYYWYLKTKQECEATLGHMCDMGGFTRILPAEAPDDLMTEIPTFMYQPFPGWDDYAPLNRPYGLLRWTQAASIPEPYVLVCETDQIFLRPLPNLVNPASGRVVGYHSDVMEPTLDFNAHLIGQTVPERDANLTAAELIPSGNSPVLMSWAQLKKVAPEYHRFNVKIWRNNETAEVWRWIREMYAFVLAMHSAGLEMDFVDHLVAIPPNDTKLEDPQGHPFYILHYAYRLNYDRDGEHMKWGRGKWCFDKRIYLRFAPPRDLYLPGPEIENQLVHVLTDRLNEATANIPCWDDYQALKRVPDSCEEVFPDSIYPAWSASPQQQQQS